MKLSTLLVLSAFVATFCVLQAEARVGERRLGWMDGWARHYAAGGPTPGRMAEVGRYVKMALDEDDDMGGWKTGSRHPNSGPRGMPGLRVMNWDQDDEAKTCSVSNYARQITAAKKRGFKPPSAACTRAVFNKLCSECKEDTECYLRGGEEVARQTPQCMSNRRRLRDRWSTGGSTPSYSYGGNTYNSGGYIANPSQSAKDAARAAGALTNREASRFGYSSNIRDEDDSVGDWTDHFRHIGPYGHGMGGVAGHWDEDDDLGGVMYRDKNGRLHCHMCNIRPRQHTN